MSPDVVINTFFMNDTDKSIIGSFVMWILLICSIISVTFIVERGLFFFFKAKKKFSEMERGLGVLGTIGNIAPLIGLFGTVIGIMHAFGKIAEAGSGGLSVVAKGISVALLTTAAGLVVAIPAVVAYNYFRKKVKNFSAQMAVSKKSLIEQKSFRTMNKKKVGLKMDREAEEETLSSPNITPLVDVSLTLVIMFMVTCPLLMQIGMEVLHSRAGKPKGEFGISQNVRVDLKESGRIFVDGEEVALDALGEKLRDRIKRSKDKLVILSADDRNKVKEIVQILDIAKQMEAEKLGILTKE